MKRIVIDASVAVKWVVQEEGSSIAIELCEKHALSVQACYRNGSPGI